MRKKALITAEAVREVLEGFARAGLVTVCEATPQPLAAFAPVSPRRGRPRRTRKAVPARSLAVKLPDGETVKLSPGEQNSLIKSVIEKCCTRFLAGGTVVYIGDAENKFLHLEAEYLKQLGVEIPAPAKMPDVVVHDTGRNWLALIEAVTSAGPVDGKRRKELKDLFAGSSAGLVFVTAFSTREIMRSFLTQISWETEVWVAEDPEHLIHFDGERFLGPYPDVMPPGVGES